MVGHGEAIIRTSKNVSMRQLIAPTSMRDPTVDRKCSLKTPPWSGGQQNVGAVSLFINARCGTCRQRIELIQVSVPSS